MMLREGSNSHFNRQPKRPFRDTITDLRTYGLTAVSVAKATATRNISWGCKKIWQGLKIG